MTTATDVLPVVAPAEGVIGPPQGGWTYADYAAVPDDGQRYEVVDGVLSIAPAQNMSHQGSSTRFVIYLGQEVELAGRGRVFHACKARPIAR